MHDAIELAKDALGDGPQDVDKAFLVNNNPALTIAHKRAERRRVVKW